MLRALAREPETGAALLNELESAVGCDGDFDRTVEMLRKDLSSRQADEFGARLLVERLALALQAAVLLRSKSPAAKLFIDSRLRRSHGMAFGTLPANDMIDGLIMRALP